MSDYRRNANHILDAALDKLRSNAATESQVAGSAERVLEHLRSEHMKVVPYPSEIISGLQRIGSCEDFQALIPAYLSSSLTSSRVLLFDDHIHECVSCRKALEAARAEPGKFGAGPRILNYKNSGSVPEFPWLRWGMTALVAAAVLIAFQTSVVRDFFWPIDVHAMVQIVDGGVYVAYGQSVHPVGAGQRIERSQVVRTGNGSRAVLQLADGSRVEMSSRSEVWLDRASDGVRVNVNRGSVTIAATKQHGGHLYGATKDLGVSVIGTVFEVSAGVGGSLVRVMEGEVRVQQGTTIQSLHPGQEFASDTAARDARIMEARHTSDLVPLVPEDTAVFTSLPNISQPLAESYQLFKQRIIENPTLAEWWQRNGNLSGSVPILDQIVDRITLVGNFLGSEVVFAFPANTNAEAPVLLADTAMPDQLASALAAAQARVARTEAEVRSFAGSKETIFYVGDGLMIASTDVNQVLRSLQFRSQPALNSFAATPLYSRLVQEYTDGISWLLAADLERFAGAGSAGMPRQLLLEQKSGKGGSGYRATLAFNGQRTGIAAWLAEPSPMGALEFISPAAYGVAGAVTKAPLLMFDDLGGILQGNTTAWQDFQNYQAEHRIDIRQDLVATLGNEFLIAVDGPVLPTPGWRVVIEVNDAARLQNTIEWAIANMNQEAAAHQKQGVVLSSETVDGRTFYSVKGSGTPIEIHYTYWAGYLIAGPTQAMLLDAIQTHDTGNSIMRSAAFRSELPADGHDYASAFIYQNVRALTGAANTLPSLVAMYGEPDRIVMSSRETLGMNAGSIAGISGILKFAGLAPQFDR